MQDRFQTATKIFHPRLDRPIGQLSLHACPLVKCRAMIINTIFTQSVEKTPPRNFELLHHDFLEAFWTPCKSEVCTKETLVHRRTFQSSLSCLAEIFKVQWLFFSQLASSSASATKANGVSGLESRLGGEEVELQKSSLDRRSLNRRWSHRQQLSRSASWFLRNQSTAYCCQWTLEDINYANKLAILLVWIENFDHNF